VLVLQLVQGEGWQGQQEQLAEACGRMGQRDEQEADAVVAAVCPIAGEQLLEASRQEQSMSFYTKYGIEISNLKSGFRGCAAEVCCRYPNLVSASEHEKLRKQ
jgi:hypothetical protein